MDKNESQFQEQDAPLKNTDNAFVQVGKDGAPVIPEPGKEKEADPETTTDLDKR